MADDQGIEAQLRDAAQLSEAGWAVLAERAGGNWTIRASYRLTKPAQILLATYFNRPAMDTWLCGALTGGHIRSSSLSDESKLGVGRIFAFPIAGTSQAILVGADEQTPEAQRTWRLVGALVSSGA